MAWGLLAGFILATAAVAAPPQIVFGPLYRAVEEADIFEDSKEFADAIPKSDPDTIMSDYRKTRPETTSALKAFVGVHFTLPGEAIIPQGVPDRRPLVQHIDALWPRLVRQAPTALPYSTLIALPQPYVVPGGRFRELYYWDSYFTMLGLSGRPDLIRDMVADFAHMMDIYGHIPNGSRTYYLSRSQPPFFFAMVGLLEPNDPAKAFAQYLPQLEAEYRFWMRGADGLKPGQAREHVVALPDGTILNRYWDDSDLPRDESYRQDVLLAKTTRRPPDETYRNIRAAAESGWDFSARWFADGKTLESINTTEIIPVDLNSLMFGLEDAIRQGCVRLGQAPCVKSFEQKLTQRRAAVNRYLWNAAKGAFLDYRWTDRRTTEILSAAVFYPLFVGLADPKQASAVATVSEKELLKPGGIVTTAVTTGQQWDSPNGWAPLQWIAITGLRRYGNEMAMTISCRWIVNVDAVYHRTGKLVEKYDVVTLNRPGGGGEYKLQDGFGWTNGVTRRLTTLYPTFANYGSVNQCPTR